jgi:hypothetical protein
LGRRINNTYLEKNWRRKPAMAVLGTRKEAGPGTGAFLITNLTWETIRDPLLLALRGSPDGWWENPQREEKRGMVARRGQEAPSFLGTKRQSGH